MKVTIYAGTKTEVLAKLAELAQAERKHLELLNELDRISENFNRILFGKKGKMVDGISPIETSSISIKDFKK